MRKKKEIEMTATEAAESYKEQITLIDLSDLKNLGRADLNTLVDKVETKLNEIIKKVNE